MIGAFIRKNLPLVMAGLLTILAIIIYNMGELLEKYHHKLMENIHYALAAIVLFGIFYVIAMLVRAVWTASQDDDP